MRRQLAVEVPIVVQDLIFESQRGVVRRFLDGSFGTLPLAIFLIVPASTFQCAVGTLS